MVVCTGVVQCVSSTAHLPDLGVSLRSTVDGIQDAAGDEQLAELVVAQGDIPAVLHLLHGRQGGPRGGEIKLGIT